MGSNIPQNNYIGQIQMSSFYSCAQYPRILRGLLKWRKLMDREYNHKSKCKRSHGICTLQNSRSSRWKELCWVVGAEIMHHFCCDLTSALEDTKRGLGWPLSHRHNYELGLGWALKEAEAASTWRWCFPRSGPRRKEHTAEKTVNQPRSLSESSYASPRTKDRITCHGHLLVWIGNPLHSGHQGIPTAPRMPDHASWTTHT